MKISDQCITYFKTIRRKDKFICPTSTFLNRSPAETEDSIDRTVVPIAQTFCFASNALFTLIAVLYKTVIFTIHFMFG